MFIEISVRGKVLYLDQALTRYRKHSAGLSRNATTMLDEYFYTLDLICARFSHSTYIKLICYLASERFVLGSVIRELTSDTGLNILISKIKNQYVPLSKLVLFLLRAPFAKSLLQFISVPLLKKVAKQ